MQRYPEIDRGMTRLLSLKRQTTRQLATTLLASVDISAHPQRLDHVADSMAITLMYWLSFEQLTGSSPNAPADHPSRCAAGALPLRAVSGRANRPIFIVSVN